MNENFWRQTRTKDQIRAMLLEQFDAFWERDTGVPREQLAELERAARAPHAVIISGLRRAGKSTLLAQMAHRLGKENFYYLNFEDDRFLGFSAGDFNDLYQTLVELFGERRIFIVDEIQNVAGWERFVRRFMDTGFKFYISGSNASLLSKELGTRLTGRHTSIELFPFSFREYLRFRGEALPDARRMKTKDRARLHSLLDGYLRYGGVPDALKYPETPVLRALYDDVLHRDIIARYQIEGITALKELAFFLMSNPAGLISYNKLKSQLQLGSVNTVKNYVGYMENSWLLFTLNVYDFSVKRRQIAPKKTYCIDPGLLNEVGFHFSRNSGKLLENAIFLALRRQTREIYYYVSSNGHEVDFYLPETRQLIQVAESLKSPSVLERETRALREALKELKPKSVLILTDDNYEALGMEGVSAEARSAAEWLLREELAKDSP